MPRILGRPISGRSLQLHRPRPPLLAACSPSIAFKQKFRMRFRVQLLVGRHDRPYTHSMTRCCRYLCTPLILLISLQGCNSENDPTDDGNVQCEGCIDPAQPTGDVTTNSDASFGQATPIFEVGYNQAGQVDPTAFMASSDQSEMPVVLGTQGSWMVVVAGMTNRLPCCVDRVDLTATVGVKNEVPLGKIKLKRRPVFRNSDGDQYIMNIFLVVPPDPEDWDGKTVELSLELTPHEGGETLMTSSEVILQQILPEALKPSSSEATN